jgi:beta-amylase
MIKQTGLKLQVVLSFHACGGNVGDTAHVPLPSWVVQCGNIDPDLWHTDRPQGGCPGRRNKEYLSVWADEASGVLSGRSPMQCYEDFMVSFKSMFESDIGTLIEEIVVGAGPCGELR